MTDQPTEDLSQRDLSQVSDDELSTAEQSEMKRRFDEFVDGLRERAGFKPRAKKKKPKRIMRWDPAAISRKH